MTELERLCAFMDISQVKARYCRFLDAKDWDGFAGLFTADFVLDVSADSKMPPFEGRDAALAFVKASLDGARTAHQVHSPDMTFDAEGADVIWAMQDRIFWDVPKQHGLTGLTGYGHYHQRYVRQDGVWKIARSRLTRLLLDVQRSGDA